MKALKICFSTSVLLLTMSIAFAKDRKDIGKLTDLRTSYDVLHYGIHVEVKPEIQFIQGSNTITFRMSSDANQIQLDFASGMQINGVQYHAQKIDFQRKSNIFLLSFNSHLKKDSTYVLTIFFSGKPKVATNPPWEGGFVWEKDNAGNHWVGLACESLGASAWLPCKDHWSDEADSIDLWLEVPKELQGISNGKLISSRLTDSLTNINHWHVSNPINNYNISINVGKFTLIRDTFLGINTLPIAYYVLEYNRESAEKHFLQVPHMLKAFEHYFGAYPFLKDSYKLVETPYWGMEHQSCIAYGNNYKNNAFGFDFIIIHESGHEWFANSITASDAADMWIHESFTTYAEALYLEYTKGYTVALEYLLMQKKSIQNKSAMLGKRDVFYHKWKDSDIYYKGTWFLHTLRSDLNNDSLWFSFLKEMNVRFCHKIIRTEEVLDLFNKHTGRSWDAVFKRYLTEASIPVLKIKSENLGNGKVKYRLKLKRVSADFHLDLNLLSGDNLIAETVLSKHESILVLDSNFELIQYLRTHYLLDLEY